MSSILLRTMMIFIVIITIIIYNYFYIGCDGDWASTRRDDCVRFQLKSNDVRNDRIPLPKLAIIRMKTVAGPKTVGCRKTNRTNNCVPRRAIIIVVFECEADNRACRSVGEIVEWPP